MFTPIAYTLDDDSKLLVLIHHIFLQFFFMVTLLQIERAGGAGVGCGETTLPTALTYPGYAVDGLWYKCEPRDTSILHGRVLCWVGFIYEHLCMYVTVRCLMYDGGTRRCPPVAQVRFEVRVK